MPNITTVNDLQGKTEAASIVYGTTTSSQGTVANEQDFLHNATTSQTFKLNTLMVANTHSADAVVNLSFYDGTTAYTFANSIVIPSGASLDALSGPIYVNNLERIIVGLETSGATIHVVASYENLTTTA